MALHQRGTNALSDSVAALLHDSEWLAEQYATKSAELIAEEVGCAPATVRRHLHRHGITVRDRSSGQRTAMPEQLYDAEWLGGQYASGRTPSQVAAELGVSTPVVYKVMKQLGIDTEGAWVRRDTRRLKRPPKRTLQRLWKRHRTIRDVAAELAVAPTTSVLVDSLLRAACRQRHRCLGRLEGGLVR